MRHLVFYKNCSRGVQTKNSRKMGGKFSKKKKKKVALKDNVTSFQKLE